jgi:glycosyltransferase involved in cell wall biosynthesis
MPTHYRILQVYNEYRHYGGEDTVADLEALLLRRAGHEVERLTVSTKELENAGALRLVSAGFGTVWSFRGYSVMRKALDRFLPDIVHVHNTFPLLSPSIYWAADQAGVPLIQTLHNYRLTCANALLFRNDRPCQDCVGRFPWPALRYRCCGGSFWQTAAVASSNVFHRYLGTFTRKVPAYVALTEFSKNLMVRAGLPQDKIFVKPNFINRSERPARPRLPQVIFLGGDKRLKGLHLLLDAWKRVAPAGIRLLLIGSGTEKPDIRQSYASDSSVVWCGFQPREKVMEYLAESRLLVFPSLAYEGFPMALLEAFSVRTPVVVPNHGAFPSLVSHLENGLLFEPGDLSSLVATLHTGLTSDEGSWSRWSENAYNKYLDAYTDVHNYEQLISIYQQTIAAFEASRNGPSVRDGRSPTELLDRLDGTTSVAKYDSVPD